MKSLHEDESVNHKAVIRLFHYSRIGLAAVLAGGILLTVILLFGAADPPRAGRAVSRLPDAALHVPVTTAPGDVLTFASLALPPPPYTLEFTSRVFGGSGLFPAWGIMLDNGPFEIRIYREKYFAVFPTSPDTTAFIHIRPAGQYNRFYLDVASRGTGTLRINDEVAWQGTVPVAGMARIIARGGSGEGDLAVQDIRLYTPGS